MSDFLYHYTTISNLALILKNRTLRLNPLNQMDDLQETKNKDIQNFGQFVYVSSWTDKEEEIIPMWKMYTTPQLGVRIGLPKNPFQIVDNETKGFRDPTEKEIRASQNKDTKGIFPIIQMEDMLQNQCIISNSGLSQQLAQIKYSPDMSELEPQILSLDGNSGDLKILLSKLGNIKNEYWSFQQEWRYIVRVLPLSIVRSLQNYAAEMICFTQSIITGQAKQPFPYIDLHLSFQALEQMQIILAPNMPEGNQILVESLVEKYNPKMQNNIFPSQLIGLIK